MKKLLAFLLICLSSTMMFAQETHWTAVDSPDYDGNYMVIATVILINGEEQYNPNLEIGVFSEVNGECRGVKYPPRQLPNGRYYYSISVFGATSDGMYTYRLFDHGEDMEIEATISYSEAYPQLSYESNGSFGALRTPWEVNFIPTAAAGIDLTIDAYAFNDPNNEGGYYLISSPVGEVDPENVTNMKANSYDLYAFDLNASDGLEWLNYKANAFTALQPGWGYLYANSGNGTEETVTLTFPGNAFTTEDGTYTVDLAYNEDAEFPGKNLVGNPFNAPAYIARDYYVMNEDGDEILPDAVGPETTIAPMQGVFVEATEDGESFMFSLNPIAGGEGGGEMGEDKIVLDLTNGRSVIDRAAVRFGQGRQLHKFQLRENSTKLYFTVDNEDYAIVRSANQGEMPVSFKAEHNGTYTLSVNAEGMNYLHLIDNRTGADVDLLASPSYTFDALTTDYASRFRLVFATGNNDDTFAFASNGSFVISNEGPATVQVIDVNGRIMSSENINGSACINVNAAAGVYMIRLINGDNVKVQKVVVK